MLTSKEISPSYDPIYTLSENELKLALERKLTPDSLKELDPYDRNDHKYFAGVVRLLTDPAYISHYGHQLDREQPGELLNIAQRNKVHVVAAVVPGTDIVAGTYSLIDSSNPDEQEHFMGYVAVHNQLQGLGRRLYGQGYGTRMFQLGLYREFIQAPSYTGVPRRKIFVGITEHGDHAAMESISKKSGMRMTQRLPGQMIYIPKNERFSAKRNGNGANYEGYLIQHLCHFRNYPGYDTLRYQLTMDEFIRFGATGKYEALNEFGLDEVLRTRYLPALNRGLGIMNGDDCVEKQEVKLEA